MPRARLLHTPEVVEVLRIDAQAGVACIRRQGFEQRIPLSHLVLEEESPLPAGEPISTPALSGATELYLVPHLAQAQAELHLIHGLSQPGFYSVYFKSSTQKTWQSLLAGILAPGESRFFSFSLQQYSPPWTIHIQRLLVCEGACEDIPTVWEKTFSLRLVQFMEGQRLPLTPLEVSPKEAFPTTTFGLRPDLPAGPPPQAIDLHIEKLAPQLQGASAEEIFLYQVQALRRYLYACEAAQYKAVTVIHGVGKKRLFAHLKELCAEAGWELEPLLVPPYLGGASRVKF